MSSSSIDDRLNRLDTAEQVLKLVLGVRTHTLQARNNEGLRRLTAPDPVRALNEERETGRKLALTREEEDQAAGALEHASAYLAAREIDTVLAESFEDRFEHADLNLRAAACIASILCESLAENHFGGVWQIPEQWKGREFHIEDVITLDTRNIAGKPVRRRDYGGPLALLQLIDMVKKAVNEAGS